MTAAAQCVRVAEDYEGLGTAARELFEEEFHAAGDEALRRNGQQPPYRRTLSSGYYLRVAHLFDVAEQMAALKIDEDKMPVTEYRGVKAIESARDAFCAAHPGCPSCGARNDRLAYCCRACGKEFKR